MSTLAKAKANFGTAPVFLTAISTILGALMFLRFGFAVGAVGFGGTLLIILIGHLVTIPTAMAIAEIATNQKVEGGGEYYIISRSFGLNIGASIGIALYLSQAISVAFYIIAFAEAFRPVFEWLNLNYGILIEDARVVSIPAMVLLATLMLTKGADVGVKALYVVVAVLFLSLTMFFMGHPIEGYTDTTLHFFMHDESGEGYSFFKVFAIIFPAFTGMTAGVGLSGDLKDPKKSIPMGTLAATILGGIIYVFIAYKLSISAPVDELTSNYLVMQDIAMWAPIIPIGLACATISSALGSIMVAPRTLQALSNDKVFPVPRLNRMLAKNKTGTAEPRNATIITIILAMAFVAIGDVDFVAEIISMFFMVTYGAICTISFLQHFAADPSYRPDFRSRWYVSLPGAILCIYMMFQMNGRYALLSLSLMVLAYIGITYYKKDREGLVNIFQGVIFQVSRQIQIFLQKADKETSTWRPSVICISRDSFERVAAQDMMRWLSHRYGFGTYIHFIQGYLSKDTQLVAQEQLSRLIHVAEVSHSNVYMDTMISPSFTTAIAQSLQLPSVSGKDNNTFLFEYFKGHDKDLHDIIENTPLVRAAGFDLCVLASSEKGFGFRKEIHIWITPNDFDNANLMILLGYIIIGHKDWAGAHIKINAIFPEAEINETKEHLLELIKTGRLPISAHNVNLIPQKENMSSRDIINQTSVDADLTLIGFREEALKQLKESVFQGYNHIGNILFVNAHESKEIK